MTHFIFIAKLMEFLHFIFTRKHNWFFFKNIYVVSSHLAELFY